MLCPCYSARIGAAVLTLAAYVGLHSATALGVPLGVVIADLFAGNITPLMAVWFGWALLGGWQLFRGLQAALAHVDPIRWRSLLWSVGVLVFVVWIFPKLATDQLTGRLDANTYQWSCGVLAAWVASNAMNLWLQLRGLGRFLPRRRPHVPVYPMPPAPVFFDGMHRQAELLARMAVERDQAIAQRDQIARELARRAVPAAQPATPVERDAGCVLKLPGVGRAVLSALHPDRFKSDAEKRVATVRFQTASDVLDKLGARR